MTSRRSLVGSIAGLFTRKLEISIGELDSLMDMVAFGAPSASGNYISEQSAMQLPAVWACVDLISRVGGVLPGNVFRRLDPSQGRDRIRAPRHYLSPLVHDMVNPTMPSSEWTRLTLSHLLTWGNSYSWIEWTDSNLPKHLWIIPPNKCRATRKAITEPIEYAVMDGNGNWVPFPAMDILHIRGLGFDGVRGYSPIGMLRNAFGLNEASQQSAANMHKSGITSRLALTVPGVLDKAQQDALAESFAAAYGGLQNQYKALILQNGMTAVPISIHPQDAQFLEQWKYSDSKIYQIYGVPPHLVGDTEKATSWGTGVEQQTIGFVNFTMVPWMDLIETWLAVKLLPDGQRTHFVEYDFKGLLRGDTTARAAWHRAMIDLGVSSPNDVRKYENDEPYEGGDVYRRPMNMTFVDSSGNVVLKTEKAGAGEREEVTA